MAADALRELLDSGKLSEEDCHSILRGLGEKVVGSHEKKKEVDGWTSDEEEDEENCRHVQESLIPKTEIKLQPACDIVLYARLGVHCLNFEKGSKLQFRRIAEYINKFTIMPGSYHITAEVKDLVDDSAHILQTLVTRSFSKNGEHLRVFTDVCTLKPGNLVKGDSDFSQLDERAVDDLYKGPMPNFLSEANPDDRLRFYEVQEQDICENDWLRLYTDFALFCYWQYNEDAFNSCLPAEINKILVETFETHTDPSLKLKSSNAIFHINFTAKSCDYISVVRRTTDGKSGHIILQINTWTNPPSSPREEQLPRKIFLL